MKNFCCVMCLLFMFTTVFAFALFFNDLSALKNSIEEIKEFGEGLNVTTTTVDQSINFQTIFKMLLPTLSQFGLFVISMGMVSIYDRIEDNEVSLDEKGKKINDLRKEVKEIKQEIEKTNGISNN